MKENLLRNKKKTTDKSPTPNDFTGNFYQTGIYTCLSSNIPRNKVEWIFPNLFYEATIILISKPQKATLKKITGKNSDKYRWKNSEQNIRS